VQTGIKLPKFLSNILLSNSE